MDLSFKDVEALFATRHGVGAVHRVAFRGRLQHLQRLRFPDGVNTGRGRPAVYDWPQIVQLSVVLDLVDLGMTPDVAAAIVRLHTPKLLATLALLLRNFSGPEELAAAVRKGCCPFDKSFFIITTAAALSGLSQKQVAAQPGLHILNGEQLVELITQGDANSPTSAFIDGGMRLCLLMNLIATGAKVDPSSIVADLVTWTADAKMNGSA